MHLKRAISIFTILILFSSCSLFHEDMTSVNEYINNEDYSSAIADLNGMSSSYAKKLNADTHLKYAISILRNIREDKRTRYFSAKDILEKAVQLDPKNKEAQTYYLMVLKLSKNV